jgi:hypothetical protein
LKNTLWVVLLAVLVPILVDGRQEPAQGTSRDDDLTYLRPSKGLQPFTPRYFAGSWSFSWDIPDSAFGPGGEIEGTEIYDCSSDSRSCRSTVKADGPAGRFTQDVDITYDEATHTVTRREKDSRGFSLVYTGVVSSAQAFYQLDYESAPFSYNGKSLRLKSSGSLAATGYRMRMQLSVDGGPYSNLGNPSWRKGA